MSESVQQSPQPTPMITIKHDFNRAHAAAVEGNFRRAEDILSSTITRHELWGTTKPYQRGCVQLLRAEMGLTKFHENKDSTRFSQNILRVVLLCSSTALHAFDKVCKSLLERRKEDIEMRVARAREIHEWAKHYDLKYRHHEAVKREMHIELRQREWKERIVRERSPVILRDDDEQDVNMNIA